MNIATCGTGATITEVNRIEDVIGTDGIEAFLERALALGQNTVGEADEEGAARFAKLFVGSYTRLAGPHCDDRLGRVYLPAGYVNVHIHDAATNRLLVGIYDDGRSPVRAISVGMAIATRERIFHGAAVVKAEHRRSDVPGVLEIVIEISEP